MNKIHKWRALSWGERGLLVETAVMSTFVWLCLRLIPFRFLAHYLLGQETQTITAQAILQANQQQAERIGRAIRVLSYRMPLRNRCLVDSIVAKLMLRRRGINTQLFLGLAKDPDRNLLAHAWLSCGDFIVTGQENHKRFTVMTSFVE